MTIEEFKKLLEFKKNIIMNKKIGIAVMFKMNHGGGAPRAVVDLIKALESFGYTIHFLTPWKLDYEKIKELYEEIHIEKEYNLNTLWAKFCFERNLSRKLMKNQFIEMANAVDLIIDIDGGIFQNYLPKNKKYIIWRLSGIDPEKSPWEEKNWKRKFKTAIKKMITPQENTLSQTHPIYAVDEWTRTSLIDKWHLSPKEFNLYPEIKTDHFSYQKSKKKNQAIILGRISPNKRLDESITIFARGAKNLSYYLVVIGGFTPDSESYLESLKELAQKEGISDRIEFIKDPSFEILKEKVEESKILIESQRDISLTMTSIECLAAGVVVLVHKNGGTYKEVLDNGRYGIGFESIEEGTEKLKKIIKGLELKKIYPEKVTTRAEFFSAEKFKERLKRILKENGL